MKLVINICNQFVEGYKGHAKYPIPLVREAIFYAYEQNQPLEDLSCVLSP